MRKYNKILEAILKGINIALDDYEDNEILSQKISKLPDTNLTKEFIDLYNVTVDLGLPSGTLWCKYNLGCDWNLLFNHPEETKLEDWYGKYYAWGELEANKPIYNWEKYKYCWQLYYDKLTKYCLYEKYGYKNYTDNLILLLPEDDAATLNIHFYNFKFHIPTKELFEELLKYTKLSQYGDLYVSDLGLYGISFISKINGNYIFLPCGGYAHNDEIHNPELGWYWSSSLHTGNEVSYAAHCLFFDFEPRPDFGIDSRCDGLLIRPVINLK